MCSRLAEMYLQREGWIHIQRDAETPTSPVLIVIQLFAAHLIRHTRYGMLCSLVSASSFPYHRIADRPGHVQSCMTESEKYESKGSNKKILKPHNAKPQPSSKYRRPSVHDASEDHHDQNQISRVEVPPPAPSPPDSGAVNVFDYLVEERSPRFKGLGSQRSASPSASDEEQSAKKRRKTTIPESAFTYGGGPIEPSLHKFDSEFDFNMQMNSQEAPPIQHIQRTPGPSRPHAIASHEMSQEDSQSGQKRKRQHEEPISQTRQNRSKGNSTLHSGLTGGLFRMLGRDDSQLIETTPSNSRRRVNDPSNAEFQRRDRADRPHAKTRRADNPERKPLPSGKELEKVAHLSNMAQYQSHASASMKSLTQSHSEYFLSLVDKGHHSHKGQSIWGVLKTFHEGVDGGGSDYASAELAVAHVRDQRRLFRGLRMKINKSGEIVLFARPDRERSQSPEPEQPTVKSIGAP